MFYTKAGELIDIEVLTWSDARKFSCLEPELIEILDEISPSDELKFYKARYPYGASILEKLNFNLPLCSGKVIPYNDPSIPEALKNDLYYDPDLSNPVGIIINKQSEFYVTIGQQLMPYTMVSPGDIFGLARILDTLEDNNYLSFFVWELTSGARSAIMLPKISESISHSKLKKQLDVKAVLPNSYKEHYKIFKAISHATNSNWRSEILFFSNKWFKFLKDKNWARFYAYCLRKNRMSYTFWRNILRWEIAFSQIEQKRHLKYSAHTLSTARHLFVLATGCIPGFSPMVNEDCIPLNIIQEMYTTYYGLKYAPTILCPKHFSLYTQQNDPIYYSLNYPVSALFYPHTFKGKSIISLLYELKQVTSVYKHNIMDEEQGKFTSLYKMAQSVSFDFYHTEPSAYESIKNSCQLPKDDPRFANPLYPFSEHSPFLRGLVRIFQKDNKSQKP